MTESKEIKFVAIDDSTGDFLSLYPRNRFDTVPELRDASLYRSRNIFEEDIEDCGIMLGSVTIKKVLITYQIQ